MTLVDSINSHLDDEVTSRLAAALAETATSTRDALSQGAIPAIVHGLRRQCDTDSGMALLSELRGRGAADRGLLSNLSSALSGGKITDALLNEGKTLLGPLLGDRVDAVAEWLSDRYQLRRTSANTLLALAVPLVAANLGPDSAVALPQAAQPISPGLASALGISPITAAPGAAAALRSEFSASWIIVPVVALLLAYSLRSCQPAAQIAAAAPAKSASIRPATAAAAAMSASVLPVAAAPPRSPPSTPPAPVALAEVVAGIARDSAAYEVATFLADPDTSAPRSFVLRDLNFTSGTAEITAESKRTLKEVARVLKAYSNARVMLQGHTDNVGSPDSNYALSRDRADAAQDALIRLGIAPARLTTAGLGADRPLASNDSAAGRRRNRRTELLVTVK